MGAINTISPKGKPVYSLSTVFIFTLIGLGLGALAGAWLFRYFGRQGKLAQELEQRLQRAERKFENYQADVTEHFAETSRRVNTLTQNYKDVHEYLASSAMKLTNPQMSRAISQAAQQNLPHGDNHEEEMGADIASTTIASTTKEQSLETEEES